MIKLNKKELEVLTEWVNTKQIYCRIIKNLKGASYSFGGTFYKATEDFECLEWDALIDKFRNEGFIQEKDSSIGIRNYTLTQAAVNYVESLK